jgi:hypothetical protein
MLTQAGANPDFKKISLADWLEVRLCAHVRHQRSNVPRVPVCRSERGNVACTLCLETDLQASPRLCLSDPLAARTGSDRG